MSRCHCTDTSCVSITAVAKKKRYFWNFEVQLLLAGIFHWTVFLWSSRHSHKFSPRLLWDCVSVVSGHWSLLLLQLLLDLLGTEGEGLGIQNFHTHTAISCQMNWWHDPLRQVCWPRWHVNVKKTKRFHYTFAIHFHIDKSEKPPV